MEREVEAGERVAVGRALGRRGIARATLTILVITAVSKLFGFAREAAIGAAFGASRVVDAYLVATNIPILFFAAVNAAATSVIIPNYARVREREGEEEALRYANAALILISVGLIAVTAASELLAPWLVGWMAPGFGPQERALTAGLTRILLPALLFQSLAGWAAGILESNQHFAAPAAIGIPYDILIVLGALVGGIPVAARWGPEAGVAFLAAGTLLGSASQLLIQLPFLRRHGWRFRWVWAPGMPAIVESGRMLVPVLISSGANAVNLFVDRLLASWLAAGSIAALNYGNRLYGVPAGLLVTPLVTVLYPTFSAQTAAEEMDAFRNGVRRGLGLMAAVTVPAVAGMVLLRYEIVRAVYERGAFDARATGMTAVAFALYGLSLPGGGWSLLLTRAFWSLRDSLTPMWVGVATVAINVGLNLVLVRIIGLAGLALSTSVATTAGGFLLLLLLRRRTGPLGGRSLAVEVGKSLLASAAMAMALAGLQRLQPAARLAHLLGRNPAAPGSLVDLLAVALVIVAGIAVYGAAAALLRMEVAAFVTETVGGRIGRRTGSAPAEGRP
ncbi:MAG: murein biosynthesis integral membrane protein MurJ [Bacillota bacterium]|nr:murein biosynthesis integral membrane protein MurJ [Bacillota bacterium]